MADVIRTRPAQEHPAIAQDDSDDVLWLALLLLKMAVVLANGIRKRYGLSRGERCPRCGHGF